MKVWKILSVFYRNCPCRTLIMPYAIQRVMEWNITQASSFTDGHILHVRSSCCVTFLCKLWLSSLHFVIMIILSSLRIVRQNMSVYEFSFGFEDTSPNLSRHSHYDTLITCSNRCLNLMDFSGKMEKCPSPSICLMVSLLTEVFLWESHQVKFCRDIRKCPSWWGVRLMTFYYDKDN